MPGVRWIHFSDLHSVLGAESDGLRDLIVHGEKQRLRKRDEDEVILARAGVGGLLQKYPIDCVIITGDIFNKGSWDDKVSEKAKKFIRELAFSGKNGDVLPSVMICAGNHDLQRDVSIIESGLPLSRAQVIKQVAEESSSVRGEGFVTCNQPRRNVLEAAFEPFVSFVSDLDSELSRPTGENEHLLKRRDYLRAGVTVDVIDSADERQPSVAFFGLNSAYLSGQPFNREECEQQMREEYGQFTNADRQMKFEDAAKHYMAYARAARRMVSGVSDDVGELSLPFRNALEDAEGIVTENECPVSVVYMHHPVSFLCDEARKSLSNFLGKVGGQVVLCGHVHRPTLEKDYVVAPSTSYSRESIVQVSAGGSFPDSEGYNCVSFSIGNIERLEDFELKYRITVDLYSYAKSPLGKWFWHHETISKDVRGVYFDNGIADAWDINESADGVPRGDSSNSGDWEDNIRDERRTEEKKRGKDSEIIEHEKLLISMIPARDRFGLREIGDDGATQDASSSER